MPTTDWNWFFSSVAQSAAAIVGIFGAFIITKILANQTAFAERVRRMHDLISSGEKLCDAATRLPLRWYHKYDTEDEMRALERLLDDDDSMTPEQLYGKLHFSPYIAKPDALTLISDAKTNREKRLKREREARRRQIEERGLGAVILPDHHVVLGQINSVTMGPGLNNARDEIDGMYTEVRHHVRVSADFLSSVSTNPESSGLVTVTLLLICTLFFAGVIYPLSFMPVPSVWTPAVSINAVPDVLFSFRGLMLSAVSVLFTTMLAMFFVLNIRLRYSLEDLERLRRYTVLATYSEYFANRDKNENQRDVSDSAKRNGEAPLDDSASP